MDEEGENQKRKLGDTYQFIQLVTESETIYSQSFSSFKCNLMRSPETKSQEDQLKVVEMFNTGKRIFGRQRIFRYLDDHHMQHKIDTIFTIGGIVLSYLNDNLLKRQKNEFLRRKRLDQKYVVAHSNHESFHS